jgi:hypothetical protein
LISSQHAAAIKSYYPPSAVRYEANYALPYSFSHPKPSHIELLLDWLHIRHESDGGDYWRIVMDRTRELLNKLDWHSLHGLSVREVSERVAPRAQEEFEDAWQLEEALKLSLSKN